MIDGKRVQVGQFRERERERESVLRGGLLRVQTPAASEKQEAACPRREEGKKELEFSTLSERREKGCCRKREIYKCFFVIRGLVLVVFCKYSWSCDADKSCVRSDGILIELSLGDWMI
jgi:hypothetical protein